MKVIGLIGASALGKVGFIENLIQAFRIEGFSVSTIKRAPDGFDLDQPGKGSHARREAGCREVMLVGDKRLVLMQEFGADPEPPLDALLARMSPVDVVIAEGFRGAQVPTIEVFVPANGRDPRWPRDKNIVAVVCDEAIDCPLPRFGIADCANLVDHVAKLLGLARR